LCSSFALRSSSPSSRYGCVTVSLSSRDTPEFAPQTFYLPPVPCQSLRSYHFRPHPTCVRFGSRLFSTTLVTFSWIPRSFPSDPRRFFARAPLLHYSPCMVYDSTARLLSIRLFAIFALPNPAARFPFRPVVIPAFSFPSTGVHCLLFFSVVLPFFFIFICLTLATPLFFSP